VCLLQARVGKEAPTWREIGAVDVARLERVGKVVCHVVVSIILVPKRGRRRLGHFQRAARQRREFKQIFLPTVGEGTETETNNI
jgi:hypothetical protein